MILKNRFKFNMLAVLCIALSVAALTGCNTANAEVLNLPEGTLSAMGYRSNVYIKAETTDEGGFLLELVSENETPGIGDLAAKTLVDTINQNQSLNVDVITSATTTSSAVIAAATAAIEYQGLDVASFNTEVVYSLPSEIQTTQYDVAIVGAGAAGLTAAIEAASRGAEVILFEKMSQAGGSSARSNGLIMASQTSFQRNNLVEDTNIGFSAELQEVAGGNVNSSFLVKLSENSSDNLFFLDEVGVPISPAVEFAEGADVARNHIIANSEETGGGLMISPLVKTATNLGVTIVYDTRITEVSADVTGTVTGVRGVYKDGSSVATRAYAVILATGGYDRNDELVNQLIGNVTPSISYSGISSNGDGIDLAEDLYADVSLNGNGLMTRIWDDTYDTNDINSLLVTPDGNRFADESDSSFSIATKLELRGHNTAYLIVSGDDVTSEMKDSAKNGLIFKGDNIQHLAEVMGIEKLDDTINSYNEVCESGTDIVYGKSGQYLIPIENKDVYAIPYKTISFGSIGGLKTNLSGEVIGIYSTLNGLFAAGELCNGNYFYETFPGFGSSLAQVVESGRTSGLGAFEHAEYAKLLPEQQEERERIREQNELAEQEAERLRQEAINAATAQSAESALEEALRITREFFGM